MESPSSSTKKSMTFKMVVAGSAAGPRNLEELLLSITNMSADPQVQLEACSVSFATEESLGQDPKRTS